VEHTEVAPIARAPREVWALVGDAESWPRWTTGLTDVHVDGELRPDAVVSYAWRGRRTKVTVSEYEPERLLAIRSSAKGYEFSESIALASMGESTRVSITMGFRPTARWAKTLAFLLAPVASLVLGRALKKSLAALRRAAEGSRPPPPDARERTDGLDDAPGLGP
jgi:uncharacterized protein YndB with AHSA1/START domain